MVQWLARLVSFTPTGVRLLVDAMRFHNGLIITQKSR